MKEYTLKPKSGKGCTWYTVDSIFGKYAKAYDRNGFETVVLLEGYDIYC